MKSAMMTSMIMVWQNHQWWWCGWWYWWWWRCIKDEIWPQTSLHYFARACFPKAIFPFSLERHCFDNQTTSHSLFCQISRIEMRIEEKVWPCLRPPQLVGNFGKGRCTKNRRVNVSKSKGKCTKNLRVNVQRASVLQPYWRSLTANSQKGDFKERIKNPPLKVKCSFPIESWCREGN